MIGDNEVEASEGISLPFSLARALSPHESALSHAKDTRLWF